MVGITDSPTVRITTPKHTQRGFFPVMSTQTLHALASCNSHRPSPAYVRSWNIISSETKRHLLNTVN